MILILGKNDVLFKKNCVIFKNENERRQTDKPSSALKKKEKSKCSNVQIFFKGKLWEYVSLPFFLSSFGFCNFISSFKDAAQPEICIEIDFGIY